MLLRIASKYPIECVFEIDPLFCVPLSGYIWQFGLFYTGVFLKPTRDKETFLLIGDNIRVCICGIMGHRYGDTTDKKRCCLKMLTIFTDGFVSSIALDG